MSRQKQVVKRDGRVVDFDRKKIESSIGMALAETGSDSLDKAGIIAGRIEEEAEERTDSGDIQSKVMDLLSDVDKSAADAFGEYRKRRDVARRAPSRKEFTDIIEARSTDLTKENANMSAETPAGMMMKFASENTKSYTVDCLLSEEARKAMEEGYIHIHDLDYYPTKSQTCDQIPLDRNLKNGFSAGHAEIRPAKRIETAATIAAISMETTQNEMHGGQAIPAFDFYMAPYVRMAYEEELRKIDEVSPLHDLDAALAENVDDYIRRPADMSSCSTPGAFGERRSDAILKQIAMNRTVDRVHQSMESFIHNMNSIHSRGGNQVVFSSINYGTDTSAEGRCIIRELLRSTYEGVGNGSTAIFPIQIWKKKRGVNYLKGDRNRDLYEEACRVTAKRFFPNFLNLDASFNTSDEWKADDPKRYIHEVATMGCRTRVFEDRFGPKTSIARGNLSFTTVNIVRIALKCMFLPYEKRKETFFLMLDSVMDIAERQLRKRLEFQMTAQKRQFPLLMQGMWTGSEKLKPEDRLGDILNHGTLGIGFIGLAEALIALTGKHHGESEEAQRLGLEIVSRMCERAAYYSEKYNHNYSILGTPAEGLSGKFTKMDRRDFGIIEGVTDKNYYTNSSHVPVYYKCTPRHKAEVEGPYHKYERGGHIFYVEIDGDATHNPEAIERIVDLMDRYDIGYGSVNHTRTRCIDCGYESADSHLEECPVCHGKNLDTIQRITGYLVGGTSKWNSAKLAELKDRVVHE